MRYEVDADTGCWNWTGSINDLGYGRLAIGKNGEAHTFLAHRLSFALHVGLPVHDDMVIDHVCRNRRCINPDHLERVTIAENNRRGEHPNMVAHRNGTCTQGHELAGDNRRVAPDGRVRCRTCQREQSKRWRDRQKETTTCAQ